jgi:FMN-dependent NADH-azoreductase
MNSIPDISCSPKGPASICQTFAQQVLARLVQQHPAAAIAHRDLAAAPPPFVDADFCAAIMDPSGAHAAFAASEHLIEELDHADAVVIATPMHNYTVPAVLKAWIDQIVRIHRTFVSTPSGKVGKLRDRPVFIVIASGGWFTGPSPTGTPAQPDFLTGYLRAVLNTIGLTDIQILALEGVTRGPEMREQAFNRARELLDRILPAITCPACPGLSPSSAHLPS